MVFEAMALGMVEVSEIGQIQHLLDGEGNLGRSQKPSLMENQLYRTCEEISKGV